MRASRDSDDVARGAERLTRAIEEDGVARPVVEAVRRVPRDAFVPPALRDFAYIDSPLPIGFDQTISQPTLVAFMTDALAVQPTDTVLEIGTGSGYQAAVLAQLARQVVSIEILEELARAAAARLARLGYRNVDVLVGDGYGGCPERAPFDAICVTADAPHVPQALVDQLADGGRLVVPVRGELILLTKRGGRVERQKLLDVAFVPLVREPAAHA